MNIESRHDGAAVPIHAANGIFQLVRLGPGEHRLRIRYLPRAYEVGRRIALGSLACTLPLLIVPERIRAI